MKSMRFALKKILTCLLCMFLLLNTCSMAAMAARPLVPETTEPEIQQVFLDHYELTDEKIIPGKDFTLKLFLKNVGDRSVEHVIVDVIYPLGTMPVYGTVSQAIVDVSAGETSVVELKYKALEKIGSPVLDFQVSLRENELQNLTILRAPVGLQSPLDVVSFFIPSRVMAGDGVNCSMTFKYLGMDTADQVSARMNVDGRPVYSVDMGDLTEESTKTQTLVNTFDEAGTYTVGLYLDYHDDAGVKKTIQVGSGVLEVTEFPMNSANTKLPQETESQNNLQASQSYVMICSAVLILVIIVIMVLLIKKKK